MDWAIGYLLFAILFVFSFLQVFDLVQGALLFNMKFSKALQVRPPRLSWAGAVRSEGCCCCEFVQSLGGVVRCAVARAAGSGGALAGTAALPRGNRALWCCVRHPGRPGWPRRHCMRGGGMLTAYEWGFGWPFAALPQLSALSPGRERAGPAAFPASYTSHLAHQPRALAAFPQALYATLSGQSCPAPLKVSPARLPACLPCSALACWRPTS
jgi:hypothetical protein